MIAYLYHSKGMITTKNGTAKELAAQMEVQGALDNHSVSQDGADRYIDCPLIGRLVSHWSPRYGWGGWYSKEHSVVVYDRDNP